MSAPNPPALPAEAAGLAAGRGRLSGSRIVVVGGGSRPAPPDGPISNGRAISLLAAREGATVAVVDANAEAAAETAKRIRGEGGVAHEVVADVSDADACAELVDASVDALGGLDGLAFNVGIGLGGRGLAATDAATWDRVLNVNLRAAFLVAQAALPMLERAIVFTGSLAGSKPGSGLPSYDASKAALLGLSRHVAAEGARRGVRSNVVAPGLIDTPLGRAATAGRPSRGTTAVPLGREGTAWEVAYAVVFLLSEEASYITGQVLTVDGGLGTLR